MMVSVDLEDEKERSMLTHLLTHRMSFTNRGRVPVHGSKKVLTRW